MSINTDGILVFFDMPLNKKDKITIIDASMMRLFEDKMSMVWIVLKSKFSTKIIVKNTTEKQFNF